MFPNVVLKKNREKIIEVYNYQRTAPQPVGIVCARERPQDVGHGARHVAVNSSFSTLNFIEESPKGCTTQHCAHGPLEGSREQRMVVGSPRVRVRQGQHLHRAPVFKHPITKTRPL
jgi:hypothetical protein